MKWSVNISKLNDCPPKDAISMNFVGYIAAHNNPPNPTHEDVRKRDFLTAAQKKIHKSTIDECTRNSLSVFDSVKNLKNQIKNNPEIGKVVVKIIIKENQGVLKRTFSNPGHYSWWVPDDVIISKLIKEIKEVNNV